MPLQWLPLQQRQQQPQRSTVSQALQPQGTRSGGGLATEGYAARLAAAEEAEAQRKYNEKMMKLQHEQGMEKAKFAAGLQEDKQKQQTTMGNVLAQGQQQGAARQKIEDNPEAAADEMWNFMLSLPEEQQQQFADGIFTPTHAGGTMSSGERTIKTDPKYNAIANQWLEKKRVTFNPDGTVKINRPEYTAGDIWKYNAEDNLMWNEKTGRSKRIEEMTEKDWGTIYDGIVKAAQTQVKDFMSETFLENLNAEQRGKFIKLEQETMENIIATRLWQAGMRDTKLIKQWAEAAIGKLDWETAIKEEAGIITEPPEETRIGMYKNWDAPLDEETAQATADFLKENPEMNTSQLLEANRDKYGDATIDRALEILKEKSAPEPTPTLKTKPKPEPIVEEEKKVKDYFGTNKYSPL